jgi:hypothetical protein
VSETGGLVENVKSLDLAAISTAFLKVIDSFREYYRIEYYPTDSRLDGKHRKIKIKLSGDAQRAVGKARILSKQGYFAGDISVIQKQK